MFSRKAIPASKTASPPMPAPREAQVPPPYGIVSVSPVFKRTCSIGTPTASAAICAKIPSAP